MGLLWKGCSSWLHHPMNIHAVRQIGRNFVGETEAATRQGKKFPMKRYSLIILLYIKFLFYPDFSRLQPIFFSQNGNNRWDGILALTSFLNRYKLDRSLLRTDSTRYHTAPAWAIICPKPWPACARLKPKAVGALFAPSTVRFTPLRMTPPIPTPHCGIMKMWRPTGPYGG